jgi:hypothetical protein
MEPACRRIPRPMVMPEPPYWTSIPPTETTVGAPSQDSKLAIQPPKTKCPRRFPEGHVEIRLASRRAAPTTVYPTGVAPAPPRNPTRRRTRPPADRVSSGRPFFRPLTGGASPARRRGLRDRPRLCHTTAAVFQTAAAGAPVSIRGARLIGVCPSKAWLRKRPFWLSKTNATS